MVDLLFPGYPRACCFPGRGGRGRRMGGAPQHLPDSSTLAVPSSERSQWSGLGLGVAGGGDVYFGKLLL